MLTDKKMPSSDRVYILARRKQKAPQPARGVWLMREGNMSNPSGQERALTHLLPRWAQRC